MTDHKRQRTKVEVIEARRNAAMGGCCDRFADNMACDCLERAIDGAPRRTIWHGLLIDSPPGCHISEIIDRLIQVQDVEKDIQIVGFVFNKVVVRRMFSETSEQLRQQYLHQLLE